MKQALWDCDSFKSPGSNGINFSFIKDFWDDLKDDMLRFLTDFHRNGKLVFLLGICSRILFIQQLTLLGAVCFIIMINFVWVVVAGLKTYLWVYLANGLALGR